MSRTKHHGNKAKQRQFGDMWHWLQSAPSWWTNLMMNRPIRRKWQLWERSAAKTKPDGLGDLDTPPYGKKPHVYFW
jgi:hypothetical protein